MKKKTTKENNNKSLHDDWILFEDKRLWIMTGSNATPEVALHVKTESGERMSEVAISELPFVVAEHTQYVFHKLLPLVCTYTQFMATPGGAAVSALGVQQGGRHCT